MGVLVMNLETVCDHAVPEKYAAVRLHMDLPVTYDELGKINEWLVQQKWSLLEELLSEKYPQHKNTLTQWVSGSQARAQSDLGNSNLRVVNG